MDQKILFLGAGNMARAMISGLLTRGFPPQRLSAVDPSQDALNLLSGMGLNQLSTQVEKSMDTADLVVIAVKPHVVKKALEKALVFLPPKTPLLSIAAGITTSSIQAMTNPKTPIIRCMPNTPSMIGRGASALFASSSVTMAARNLAEQVTNAVGLTIWVEKESLLDVVTAVSGSGPAYFFKLMDAVIKTGVDLGLDATTVTALTKHTALGAAELALQSDATIKSLCENVTSPGGTTESALRVLEEGNFQALIKEAVMSGAERSKKLGEEFF